MRYLSEENRIYVSVSELVRTVRRGISPHLQSGTAEPREVSSSRSMNLDFSTEGLSFCLYAKAPIITEVGISHTFKVYGTREKPGREELEVARGEGYIFVHMLYSLNPELMPKGDITLEIIYKNQDTGRDYTEKSTLNRRSAEAFFNKCIAAIVKCGSPEIERVSKRLPTMRAAKFPFPEIREGQSEFIKAAYRTIARGGEMYSEAPTGTGKTVSVLFPAIRALGGGRCEKVFYLTPKGTTAEAVKDTLNLMAEGGVRLRGVILLGKEKLCPRGTVCHSGIGRCPADMSRGLLEATSALFDMALTVITPEDIRRVAREFGTCPHELSLSYSELCDIVVCDFNYLFDPRAYIRRFFTRGGAYAFLIDEAHNLADRAREMYSAELSSSDLDRILTSPEIGELSPLRGEVGRLRSRLWSIIYPLIKDEIREGKEGERVAAYHTKALPNKLYQLLDTTVAAAEEELARARGAVDDDAEVRVIKIRDFLTTLQGLSRAIASFDEGYELFIFLEGEEFRIKIFCIDTAKVISERLAKGRSAIFFSGTLTPISYYRSLLGGDGSSFVQTLPSPFTEEQLSICVMDKISTRSSERHKTLPAVVRAIAATLSAKRGNYMIFAPSFAYAKELYTAFCIKYPKIKAILQTPNMTGAERESFLHAFDENRGSYLAAFAVLGGSYSEGIDLAGDRLIGAVVVGIGMPALSFEREAIAAYYEEKLEEGVRYAYIYPGMNRVLQAAGRVIRTENDRGVIVLIDDRFDDPIYKKTAPALWRGMKFIGDPKELNAELASFWGE